MRHFSLSPLWINRIEKSFLPWMQDELKPVNEAGDKLLIKDALSVDMYLGTKAYGEKTVHLYLSPCSYSDIENVKMVERQFCASCDLDDLPPAICASLESFSEKYDKECAVLSEICSALGEAGMPFDFMKDGTLVGSMIADRLPFLGQDNKAVEEWSGETPIVVVVSSDKRISLSDGEAGGLILPEMRASSIEDILQKLTLFASAIDGEISESAATKIIESLLNDISSS